MARACYRTFTAAMLLRVGLVPLVLCATANQDCGSEVSLLQRRELPDSGSLSQDGNVTDPKEVWDSIWNRVRQESAACPPGTICGSSSHREHAPTFPAPSAIPAIDYADPRKTQAAWQAPMQKTYDPGIRSPALGWNSWNQFNLDVSEAKVLSVAQANDLSMSLDSPLICF